MKGPAGCCASNARHLGTTGIGGKTVQSLIGEPLLEGKARQDEVMF